MKNKMEYLAVFSAWVFYFCYFVYYYKTLSIDMIDSYLFAIFTPFIVMSFGISVLSIEILFVLIAMIIVLLLTMKWRYKFWLWAMMGWAYIGLCFWCRELIATV